MHFTQSLLATLAILTTASAVVVPETLGDGFFEGARDTATGEMIWTKIEEPAKRDAGPIGGGAARALGSIRRDLGATSASSSSPMEKRDQVGCASGAAVDWNDYWLGHDQINSACTANLNIPSKRIYLWVRGSAFWYVCNYNNHDENCKGSGVKIALDSIRYRCGAEKVGWDHLDSDNLTYGLEVIGREACGNL